MAYSVNPSGWIEAKVLRDGKRKKYRYRIEVDGRRLPAGPWTPRQTWAQEELDKELARLWSGDRQEAARRRRMLWDSFIVDYERNRKALVPETWARFDKYATASFSSLGKASGRHLQMIDKKQADDWIVSLLSGSDPYSKTTVGMWVRSLTTLFNDAKAQGLITKNPFDNVVTPDDEDGGRALRDHELSAIFKVARPELWRAGLWDLNCGPRLGEVVVFDWTMVEDERVHGALAWFGRIPARLRKARQKVKKDCRFPINAEARELMGPRRQSGLVFPYSYSTLQHQFVAARDLAGVPDASFHWLRHTFATRFLARGGHMEDLLETKLWADYKSLLRYIHLDDETLLQRFQAAAQPVILPPPSPQKQEPPAST